jgi:hypothetical protein
MAGHLSGFFFASEKPAARFPASVNRWHRARFLAASPTDDPDTGHRILYA